MLKSIIIDDDELSRKALKQAILRCEDIDCIKEYSSAENALTDIQNLDCDLIFLDIEMPGMNGLEFIKKAVNIPQIIIVSSKSDYAAEAFDYDVTDYLVKPFSYERFLKSINRALLINEEVLTNSINECHMFFKKNNTLIRVNFEEINYIEAYADYVTIYTKDQKFVVLSTMKAIEQRFPKKDFMRVHRSYIIRLDKIKTIEENSVCINDKAIPISRSCKSEFIKSMNIF